MVLPHLAVCVNENSIFKRSPFVRSNATYLTVELAILTSIWLLIVISFAPQFFTLYRFLYFTLIFIKNEINISYQKYQYKVTANFISN